ncbi:heme-binding protein 2-like [Mizuhopecten yessoensis]|uniref:Heme-binding protein 2 n=1 Tax=Mizuhopecten yessoensis TaxID=6573 RepID=A0A210QFP0_MIZYE|nr:heme-binding protein 2-like [Mizuhopecten yessoensis]OWF47548.1 Heme-binding protein 2 [Mizuhopecten yessoensis]
MKTMLFACFVTLLAGADAAGFLDLLFGVPTDPPGLLNMTNKHWFCHDLDCPAYEPMMTPPGYEKRRYEDSKWVATNVTTNNYGSSQNSQMFNKLFKYISGENSMHQKVPMTAPVLKHETPGATPGAASTHIMYFMVPHDMRVSTPAPTDPSVYLVTLPSMVVYVGSYSGYASQSKDTDALNALRAELKTTSSNSGYTFTAGYDSPFNLIHRHNEVWIVE